MTNAFLREFILQSRQLSMRGWALAVLAGTSLAAIEGVTWHWEGPNLLGVAALAILGATSASYVLCMGLLAQRLSLLSAVWFIGSYFILLTPLIVSVVLIGVAAQQYEAKLLLAALPFLLMGVIVSALFVAWPVLQATETSIVSLARVFRATEGYRWPLFLASVIIGAINRIELNPGASAQPDEILLACAVSAVMGTISVVVFASVWATAWQFAVRADPKLLRENRHGRHGGEARA